MTTELSLQEKYAPKNACFGCGPANAKGLHVRSFAKGIEVVCNWKPEAHHEAFPGVLNGGIIGAILDCHCNWTAAHSLMNQTKSSHPPCTVTAEYSIKLLRPTPSNETVHLVATIVESTTDRAVVQAKLEAGGKICASCRGVFVAVTQGHPAFHRW